MKRMGPGDVGGIEDPIIDKVVKVVSDGESS